MQKVIETRTKQIEIKENEVWVNPIIYTIKPMLYCYVEFYSVFKYDNRTGETKFIKSFSYYKNAEKFVAKQY
jgi:hypothetical protein